MLVCVLILQVLNYNVVLTNSFISLHCLNLAKSSADIDIHGSIRRTHTWWVHEVKVHQVIDTKLLEL